MQIPGGGQEIKRRTGLLLVEYQTASDSRQREIENKVLELNDPLVIQRMERFSVPSFAWDDVAQEARLGMLIAIRKYDPGPDKKQPRAFSTFAVKAIDGYVCNWFRDRSWAMSVSREEKSAGLKAIRAEEPEDLGMTPGEFEKAKKLIDAQQPMELLDESIHNLPDEKGGENHDEAIALQIIRRLPEEHSLILELSLVRSFTDEEMAVALITDLPTIERIREEALELCRAVTLSYE